MHEPSRPALVERVGDMPDAPKAVAGQHPPPSMIMTAWEEVLLQDNERDLLQQREAVGREADLPRGDLCDRLVSCLSSMSAPRYARSSVSPRARIESLSYY